VAFITAAADQDAIARVTQLARRITDRPTPSVTSRRSSRS